MGSLFLDGRARLSYILIQATPIASVDRTIIFHSIQGELLLKLARVFFFVTGLVAALCCGAIVRAVETAAAPDASAAGPAADQRADRLRRPARFAFPLYHSRHRGAADRVQRRGLARRADGRPRPPATFAECSKEAGVYKVVLRAKNARGSAQKGFSHRHRRPDLPHAAAGLEQLELLGGGRRSGQGAPLGPGDGRLGADRSRLDLHQHRRHLAGPARRPLQRHPGEQEVPRHEAACATRSTPWA